MGDTEDLLLDTGFFEEAVFLLEAGRFLLVDVDEDFFLIGVGVVLAFEEAFGLGVPLMGLELLLAGVGVCFAIMLGFENGVCKKFKFNIDAAFNLQVRCVN